MSTMTHRPTQPVPEKHGWHEQLRIPEMWAGLAIFAMWTATAVASIWGGSFVSTSSGGYSTTIPSGIAVAFFAAVGSWVVAKFAFRHQTDRGN